MSQYESSLTLTTSEMPVVSDLFASYSDTYGFWIKERSVPTTKDEEEATAHPLSSSLLHVDIARELRSVRYSRNKVKNEAKLARGHMLKRQVQIRQPHPPRRGKGAKRSGKRQSVPQDLAEDLENDYPEDFSDSVFLGRREDTFAPVRAGEDRSIPTSIPPELLLPTERIPKGFVPSDAYPTATLPESTFDVLSSDIAREFRSYERHRHQTKKNARFTQSKQKKGIEVKPVRSRSSKMIKTQNLQSLVALSIADEETSSEDDVQTPIEVSLSLVLPDPEYMDGPASPAIDMETLITMARVKYAKEPGFEYIKNIRPVVALDDFPCTPQDDDNEPWEHVWNDDLID